MIEHFQQALPHGITLSCRAAGERGRPGADVPARLSRSRLRLGRTARALRAPENGGYRCVAPNLRGYEQSVAARRRQGLPRQAPGAGHRGADRGSKARRWTAWSRTTGAAPWPGTWPTSCRSSRRSWRSSIRRIPGTFLRELQNNPEQQAASAYMNFLIRPDAEQLLRERRLPAPVGFFSAWGGRGPG